MVQLWKRKYREELRMGGKNVWGCEGDESLQREERTQNRRDEQMVLYLSSQNGITLPPNLI